MEASAQRNLVVLSDGNCTQTYDVDADSFSACVDRSAGRVSFDATGQRLLVGHEIYSPGMTLLRAIPATDGTIPEGVRNTMISPDGQHVYAFESSGTGFVRSSAMDGELLDRTPVSQRLVGVADMQISRGGRYMVLVGINDVIFNRAINLVVVDLAAPPTMVNTRR